MVRTWEDRQQGMQGGAHVLGRLLEVMSSQVISDMGTAPLGAPRRGLAAGSKWPCGPNPGAFRCNPRKLTVVAVAH